ncbi:hypothetical protein GCM10010404_08890 [Nonomuraea africana]|uniref:Multiple sugar transport system substrate-binding protein n=1 Tax=Nonomuraea africana TaxID=46171 RepID=A0ABR9KKM3_9ACTN|nr:extracellular solute-binding protein [Nonomuraea africana]MBE1562365.1 multiple sugar transport system substrate-binding protein [Nonomuraea africana]
MTGAAGWFGGWLRRHRTALCVGVLLGVAAPLAAMPPQGKAPPDCPRRERIQVATGSDVSVNGYRRRLFTNWNATNAPSDKDVDVIELSPVADVKRSEMLAALQGDGCPRYDVVILDAAWTAEFAAAGLLEPMTGVPSGRFVPAALATGQWKGTQYALPFATDVGLLFRRAGGPAPAGWRDLYGNAALQGFVTQNDDYEGGTVTLLEVTGGVLKGERVVVDARAKEGLAAWWHARETQKIVEGPFRERESLTEFVTGSARYLRHWPYAYLRLAEAGVKVEVSPLPGGGALGGSNLAIAARSELAAESRAFVDYLTRADNQRQLFSCGGYAPVVEAAYERVDSCQMLREDGSAPASATPAELGRLLETVHQALAAAERPALVHYAQFSQTLRDCVRTVLEKDHASGAEFADAVERALATALPDAVAGRPGAGEKCR